MHLSTCAHWVQLNVDETLGSGEIRSVIVMIEFGFHIVGPGAAVDAHHHRVLGRRVKVGGTVHQRLHFEVLPLDGHLEDPDMRQVDVGYGLDEVLVVLPHRYHLVVGRRVDAGVGHVRALAGHGEVAAVEAFFDVKVSAVSTVELSEMIMGAMCNQKKFGSPKGGPVLENNGYRSGLATWLPDSRKPA